MSTSLYGGHAQQTASRGEAIAAGRPTLNSFFFLVVVDIRRELFHFPGVEGECVLRLPQEVFRRSECGGYNRK